MSFYAQKWDEYILSDDGKKGSDPMTLGAAAEQKQYLENRLRRAFEYGWAAGTESTKADAMAALRKLMFDTDL